MIFVIEHLNASSCYTFQLIVFCILFIFFLIFHKTFNLNIHIFQDVLLLNATFVISYPRPFPTLVGSHQVFILQVNLFSVILSSSFPFYVILLAINPFPSRATTTGVPPYLRYYTFNLWIIQIKDQKLFSRYNEHVDYIF